MNTSVKAAAQSDLAKITVKIQESKCILSDLYLWNRLFKEQNPCQVRQLAFLSCSSLAGWDLVEGASWSGVFLPNLDWAKELWRQRVLGYAGRDYPWAIWCVRTRGSLQDEVPQRGMGISWRPVERVQKLHINDYSSVGVRRTSEVSWGRWPVYRCRYLYIVCRYAHGTVSRPKLALGKMLCQGKF